MLRNSRWNMAINPSPGTIDPAYLYCELLGPSQIGVLHTNPFDLLRWTGRNTRRYNTYSYPRFPQKCLLTDPALVTRSTARRCGHAVPPVCWRRWGGETEATGAWLHPKAHHYAIQEGLAGPGEWKWNPVGLITSVAEAFGCALQC